MAERRAGRHARRRGLPPTVTGGLAVLVLATVLAATDEHRSSAAAADRERGDVSVRAAPTTAPAPAAPARRVARVTPGPPDRIRIPALAVDAPVDPVAAPDGVLRPPADPSRVGWWSAGAPAGARRGTTLLAGHSVSAGDGALDDLAELTPGETVEVRLAAADAKTRVVRYRVESVTAYDRDELAADAAELFRSDGRASLAIVTCIDFDGVRYRGNVVVRARPVPPVRSR
ncbi:class F sortase [Nocardioides sp. R1-1]|uniref:class F sortase n=1 Tax=Nocardioides sp. R1-1 TaxID=3383502 RepID=UPI0038D21AED